MARNYVSADDFLAGILGETVDYELAGVGLVQVRTLTFAEVRELTRRHQGDVEALTLGAVALGLVQPALTAEQAARLEQAKVGVIAELSGRIMQLSGMVEGLPAVTEEALGN